MRGAEQIANLPAVVIATLLAAIATTAAASTCRTLRGTTLVGAQLWVCGCLVSVAAVEIWLGLGGSGRGVEPLRYFAATLTFCPLMALLGAKRPQDRPWHFIVFSLWLVLALPALHVWLLRSGQNLQTPPALGWFMLGLALMGFLNRLMTRAWLSGLLFACGQAALLADHLPLLAERTDAGPEIRALVGLGLIAVSAVLSWWVSRRRSSAEPLDRLWLEFRDLFGVFWALRLAERVNSAATATKSDHVLRWSGFQTAAGGRITKSLSPETIRVLRQGLENLLRRFVSREWITERLKEPDHLTGAEHETP